MEALEPRSAGFNWTDEVEKRIHDLVMEEDRDKARVDLLFQGLGMQRITKNAI